MWRPAFASTMLTSGAGEDAAATQMAAASLRFIRRDDMEAEGYAAYLDQVEVRAKGGGSALGIARALTWDSSPALGV